MIGLTKRTFSHLNKDTLIKLYNYYNYKALVRPHPEYGNVVWFLYSIFKEAVGAGGEFRGQPDFLFYFINFLHFQCIHDKREVNKRK